MSALDRSFLARLRNDARGATVIEFALIALPVCILMMGGMEVAYESYVRAVMQGALTDAARDASVETPDLFDPGDTIEKKVEAAIRRQAGRIAVKAEITVKQRNFYEFSGVNRAEKLLSDVNGNGEFDEEDGDCWEDANDNGMFDLDSSGEGRGSADDIAFYSARVVMPRLFPVTGFVPMKPDFDLTIETAVRNQPYGDQKKPAVLCGEAS